MPADRYFSYATEPEVRAFIEGVKFVNDSALEVQGLYWIPKTDRSKQETIGSFVVHLIDTDKPVEDSEDAPVGFNSPLKRPL
jgi:hypothetical protein